MSNDFDIKLNRLAHTIAKSSGVQKGSQVLLYCFAGTEQLAALVRDWCFHYGADHVFQQVVDPISQLATAQPHMKYHFSDAERLAWDMIVKRPHGVVIQLRTEVNASVLDEDASYPTWFDGMWDAHKAFKDVGVAKSQVPWTLFYAPSDYIAGLMFPYPKGAADSDASWERVGRDSLRKAWDAVFAATFSDQQDASALWRANLGALRNRSDALNRQQFSLLRFTGPGTDLYVGLTPKAIWKGGQHVLDDGRVCVHNVPTFEVYTTPDWRRTEGHVRVTRPLVIQGKLVSDMSLVFEQGRVVEVAARTGQELIEDLISRDKGAAQLGEVALVGTDSPIARQNQLFYQTLFDENAACHIAVGSAYRACLDSGPAMSDDQLAELGCNSSAVHQDLMISDENTQVMGITPDDDYVILMDNGRWTDRFQ